MAALAISGFGLAAGGMKVSDGGPRQRDGRPTPVGNARDLRRRMTPAEEVLWRALRDRRLAGTKFRRQHPFGPFVVDFCCRTTRLVVELDGPVHDDQAEQDAARTEILAAYGFRVLRFRNEEVFADLESVLDRIRTEATKLPNGDPLVPSPSSRERGGL